MEKVKFRNELKYIISFTDYLLLKSRLKYILKPDPLAGNSQEYHIRSLYFDEIYDNCYFEKLSGICSRDKFRIRIYNFSDNIIKFEKKSKKGQFIYKETASITKEQYYSIIKGDIDFTSIYESNVLRQFYLKLKNNLYRPTVIVDYTREAYVHSLENIRVTFDKNLKSCSNQTDIFEKELPTIPALQDTNIILEIKFNRFLPDYIKNIIQASPLQSLSVSKYILCREVDFKNIEGGYKWME